MAAPTILQEITARRRARISAEGVSLGATVPAHRTEAVRPFPGSSGIICEIKRRSPSRGFIGSIADPVEQAGLYKARGVGAVSVLTEGDYFGGTLDDLMEVKRAHPKMSVLRKDFLLEPREVEISYRAGADAVLLIAAVLAPELMEAMLAEAEGLGMTALVEVHDRAEINAVRPFEPPLLGMNSRDLHSFTVDRAVPLRLAGEVDWPAQLVFESGIRHGEDVRLAREAGFTAVLVGETAVAHPERLQELVRAAGRPATVHGAAAGAVLHGGAAPSDGAHPSGGGGRREGAAAGPTVGPGGFFWRRLYARAADPTAPAATTPTATAAPTAAAAPTPIPTAAPKPRPGFKPAAAPKPGAPLIKICGITNRADAEAAVAAGADLLGFIFAPSPRRVSAELLRELVDLPVPKVAVVVARRSAPGPGDTRRGETGPGDTRRGEAGNGGGGGGGAGGDPKHGGQSGHAEPSRESGGAADSRPAAGAALPEELPALLREGLIDAVQLHGDERPEECAALAFPYYKALRIRRAEDVEGIREYRSPRVLIDAFVPGAYGGSGTRIDEDAARAAAALQPLWLAGGLRPDNVGEIVGRLHPELIDVSSGVESEPGRKDHAALRRFIAEARRA